MSMQISGNQGTLQDRVRSYLETVSMPPQLNGDLDNLRDYICELDPSNPNARTLSQYRKNELERRVEEIFSKIDLALNPPVFKTPIETLNQQINALQQIIDQLSTVEHRTLLKLIKQLGPNVSGMIYHAVWILSDCPNQARFASELLKKDSSILKRRFPGIFASTGGTILEQVLQELNREYRSLGQQATIASLRAFAQEISQPAFDALPSDIQQMITSQFGALDHCDAANVEGFAEEQQILLDQFTREREDQKVDAFNAFSQPIQVSSAQLKALFKSMPIAVQERLPPPPYWGRGFQPDLYKTLGAHYNRDTQVTTFRVYAPNASAVVLKLSAFKHVQHTISLAKGEDGVWTAETNRAGPGRSYHFLITGPNGGAPVKKVDPFAFSNIIHCSEVGRDDHESMVYDINQDFPWTDSDWMANRSHTNPSKTAVTIHEVHAPSWRKKENGDLLNWRELAVGLANYCREMGFTHIEVMAVLEHPQLISMGYQITSYFATNSRMGKIEDFQFFVNYMHEQNIGVFIDWVPAHFALDGFSLKQFDGSPLLEDENPKFAYHPTWGTCEFDFSKRFTKDFLGSNLDFLLNKFHVDGLRVDAVWSMLNLDYDRAQGSRKNKKGGHINLDAKAFLRNCIAYAKRQYPGVLMMAEESFGYSNLTRSAFEKGTNGKHGIGFDLTWHMGFMHDILEYMRKTPQERRNHYFLFTGTVEKVDVSIDVRPRGKVVLPFSHDECANGKGSIQKKMPGNDFERFANGRLLLAYQLLRGGGPILEFMGNEILQSDEWHGRLKQSIENPHERNKPSVQWEELDPAINIHNYHYHRGAQESCKVLNHLFLNNVGLHDQTNEGFSWIRADDSRNGVLSFHRRNQGQQFACIFNTSGNDIMGYRIPLPGPGYAPELIRLESVREVYNTDDLRFAGQGRINETIEIVRSDEGSPTHFKLRLPPFSAIVLEEQFLPHDLS